MVLRPARLLLAGQAAAQHEAVALLAAALPAAVVALVADRVKVRAVLVARAAIRPRARHSPAGIKPRVAALPAVPLAEDALRLPRVLPARRACLRTHPLSR